MKHKTVIIGLGFLLAASGTGRAVTLTNIATADTHIRIGSPTSNFGTTTTLHEGDYVTPNTAYRSMLQFDVSGIPSGTVLSATLRLQNANSGVNNGEAYGYIHRLTDSWSETQVTWNNRLTGTPWTSAGGDFDGSVTNATMLLRPFAVIGNSVYNVNVTALVQGWVNGTYANNGLIIKSSSEGTSNFTLFYLESRESAVSGATLPSLVIVHDIPEPTVMALALAGGLIALRARRHARS